MKTFSRYLFQFSAAFDLSRLFGPPPPFEISKFEKNDRKANRSDWQKDTQALRSDWRKISSHFKL